MDQASEAILSLKPVAYRYKKALDPTSAPQFGLLAEDVANVDRDLVIYDDNGKPFSVRYEEVNSMLLNEFLKEHLKVEEQEAKVGELKTTVANQATALVQQQKAIAALTSQIQKVSDQMQLESVALHLVATQQ